MSVYEVLLCCNSPLIFILITGAVLSIVNVISSVSFLAISFALIVYIPSLLKVNASFALYVLSVGNNVPFSDTVTVASCPKNRYGFAYVTVIVTSVL